MNYVLNEEKMFADVTDGIAIIINSETGIYYGLNGLGTNVYENLVNGVSTDKIIAGLKGIAGCPADIEDKFNSFIKAMKDFELIVEGGSDSAEANINEEIAKEESFEMCKKKLLGIYGVGEKVANCIVLFSLHKINAFPIDTWMKKVIEIKYNGSFPFKRYDGFLGIIQQYLFYHAKNVKNLK